MIRTLPLFAALAALALMWGGGDVSAQQRGGSSSQPASKGKPAATPADKRGAQGAGDKSAPAGQGGPQATLIQSYGDWGVYATGSGKTKVCYALSKPKSRHPSSLKDIVGYMFVSTRPAERVNNEISLIMNFDLKEKAEHQAVIGSNEYTLVAKGRNLWVKNPAEERKVVDAMRRASDLTVKGVSAKNNATADKYSLKGFSDAIDRVHKECR